MIAQLYLDSEPIVRLFIGPNSSAIADLYLEDPTPYEANRVLKLCHWKRKTKWKKREWGWEAKVY